MRGRAWLGVSMRLAARGRGVSGPGRRLGVHRIHIVLRRGSPREGASVDAEGLTGDRGGRQKRIGHVSSFPGGARRGFRFRVQVVQALRGGGAGGLQVRPGARGAARGPFGKDLLATRKNP